MNILICISHVPDTTTKIQFTADGSELDKNGVSFVVNPYDEFALSRAMEFKENKTLDGEIHVLCVGSKEVEPTIRKALAVGADKGIRIDGPAEDAFYVSKQIADYVREHDYGMVMMGKESIDNNGSEVPGMVAALLEYPFVSFATFLEWDGGDSAVITREVEGGTEKIKSQMPFVLSAQKGLAEWRIPNMRGIMQARKKPLDTLQPADAPAFVENVHYELPPSKGGCTFIDADNIEELVKVLDDKGVI